MSRVEPKEQRQEERRQAMSRLEKAGKRPSKAEGETEDVDQAIKKQEERSS